MTNMIVNTALPQHRSHHRVNRATARALIFGLTCFVVAVANFSNLNLAALTSKRALQSDIVWSVPRREAETDGAAPQSSHQNSSIKIAKNTSNESADLKPRDRDALPKKQEPTRAKSLIVKKGTNAPNKKPTSDQKPTLKGAMKKKQRIPSVVLAGTQKASTSSLAVYLMQLDNNGTDICFSDGSRNFEGHAKESHFFDEQYQGGLALLRDLYKHCPENALLMDGTPETMLHPERVKRIYDQQGTADQVKIIFILREPVSREISWYNHRLAYAMMPNPPLWAKKLIDNKGNIKTFLRVQRSTVLSTFEKKQWGQLYGYYAHWLRKWSKVFDRRKQILILSFDELVRDPTTLLHRVHEFLNISEVGASLMLTKENSNSRNTSAPPCEHQLELAKRFEGPNEELYAFLEEHPGPPSEQRPFPKFQLLCEQ